MAPWFPSGHTDMCAPNMCIQHSGGGKERGGRSVSVKVRLAHGHILASVFHCFLDAHFLLILASINLECSWLGVMAHTFNPRWISEFKANLIYKENL